jgi:chromosome segregation ATPase
MFNEELDPENEDQSTPAEDEGTQDAATSDESQQSGDDATQDDGDRDWEASYKGLQRASERKIKGLEEQLEKANSNLAATTDMLETAKLDGSALDERQKEAEQAKTKLEDDIHNLEAERDKLQKQLDQQNVVMNEFPHLAPVAKFIPAADDEEGFRKGAEELSKALNSMIDQGVETSLSGSSPTFEEGEDEELESSEELEQAWATVYEFAGNPEKQEEYDAAFAIIQKAGQEPET